MIRVKGKNKKTKRKKKRKGKHLSKVNQKKGLVKIKTHRVGVTEVLYKQLKKRQKSGELLLAMMNEFCTSKVCHPCQDMTLTTTMIDLHSVLTCKSCGIIWQRDLNAFKNIFKISKDINTGYSRPPIFL
ncbi:hypothetical protein BCV71DRAFT_239297 [Rhizopus microsporus]|uniref:Cas12f1-like TNB domain-containing protein n=1 Tax=Rhizopus microsporus TaxID=58291 RepID=A0A1X0RMY5_RHIZD|nr:hypothetical protein BCV71DRAFT_239297 [Rhizopus microsporus]